MKSVLSRSPLWLIAFCLFVAHQISEKILFWDFPILDSYLDPFLMGILCPGIWLGEKIQRGGLTLDQLELLAAFLLLSFVSEWLFPFLSSHFVQDGKDLIGIALGLVLFQIFMNQPSLHTPQKMVSA